MDLARIRQWCDEDNWHIEGFRNVDIIAENGRELALCASPNIARRLCEGRQYVKELLAALDGVDALVKAAREALDEIAEHLSGSTVLIEQLEAALAALDGEPK